MGPAKATRRAGLLLAAWLAAGCGGKDGPSLETVEKACVARNACGVQPYARVADCVTAYYGLHRGAGLSPVYAGIYSCMERAHGDCEAVFACFGSSRSAPRCDRSFVGSCDGDRALSCDLLTGQPYALDCSAAGLTCGVAGGGSFEATCTPGSCDRSTAPSCAGDQRRSCTSAGLFQIEDCASKGLSCRDGSCSGEESCSGSSRCEGEVAVSCASGGTARQDCAAQAYLRRCEGGRCVPAGDECRDELDRCAGSELEACLEGSWRRFDCAELGFAACQAGKVGAACAPSS